MKPERYKRVDQVFQLALSQPPERLRSFLDESCAGDEDLRREVESLLRHEREAGSLLDSPARVSGATAGPETTQTDIVGRTLLHYRIVQKIGEGGMGEVYRAEDTNLHRRVAVKVLPDEFSHDVERLARFQREAQLLASLSHPNIATLHGLEESDGNRFIVMELVEGQTLARRLQKGALPVEEALEVCRQIAEGLEAAHEKGVIHRDLKPGNVMLTADGKVKILDFGLARVFRGEGAGDLGLGGDAARSPTITEAMTRPGVILGTAAYMSPEQARGKPVDKRADIWGFGCVMFECLTGRRAFPGETVTETLAAVLSGSPDWSLLPAETPAAARSALRRCLQRDPALRLRDVGDARLEISGAALEPSMPAGPSRPLSPGQLTAASVAILVVGVLIGLVAMRSWRPGVSQPPQPVVRTTMKLEPGHWLDGVRNPPPEGFENPTRTAMALSSDGRFVVYSAVKENPTPQDKPRLYLRRIDQLEAKPIAGTEGGLRPFLSPDDRWVGFWADGKLMKVSVDGGAPEVLCEGQDALGASWGDDNQIVFVPGWTSGLARVPANGGKPETLTVPVTSNEELLHWLPCCLPKARGVLFTVRGSVFDSHPRVGVVDLTTRKWRLLLEDAADARYLASGHLTFVRQGRLMVAPFDQAKLDLAGQPVPTTVSVMQALNSEDGAYHTADGQFSTSASGSLVYVPGGILPDMENSLVSVDFKGKSEPIVSFKAPFAGPRLSPDGRRIAYSTFGVEKQVWIYDLERGTVTRLTFDGAAIGPIWTPDGRRVVFGWAKAGDQKIYWQPADGSSPMERLVRSEGWQWAGSFSPDGATLAFFEFARPGNPQLLNVHDRKVNPFLNSRFDGFWPELSPDGRWMAYGSFESGRCEVYVQPFPGPGGKWQISNDGGTEPLWGRNGKQLFYRRNNRICVTDIQTKPDFSASKPRMLFEQPGFVMASPVRSWDISLNGQRFLMVKAEERKPQPVTEMILVQSWFEEVKRLCPTGRN
jgi:eukaryotic-like serine/threonine-protein kinase